MSHGSSSAPPLPPSSIENLDEVNAYLNPLSPEKILQWGFENLPGLYQTTAFGLTGLVAIDMLSKITKTPPPLILIDTLYHFPETYDLIDEVRNRYNVPVHVYKPEGCSTVDEFEKRYGQRLWETDEITYDYVVKVSTL
jgi:phosphoadenosine phosphosulfate reductase